MTILDAKPQDLRVIRSWEKSPACRRPVVHSDQQIHQRTGCFHQNASMHANQSVCCTITFLQRCHTSARIRITIPHPICSKEGNRSPCSFRDKHTVFGGNVRQWNQALCDGRTSSSLVRFHHCWGRILLSPPGRTSLFSRSIGP